MTTERRTFWTEHPLVTAGLAFAGAASLVALGMAIQAASTVTGTVASTDARLAGPSTTVADGLESGLSTTSKLTTTDQPNTTVSNEIALEELALLEARVTRNSEIVFVDLDPVSMNGTSYEDALIISLFDNRYYYRDEGLSGDVQFDLAREFSTFTATVGMSDDSTLQGSVELEVADEKGRTLHSARYSLGESEPIKLDVTEVLRLVIKVRADGGQYDSARALVFADPTLKR